MDKRLEGVMEYVKRGEEFCIYDFPEAYTYMLEIQDTCNQYNSMDVRRQEEERIEVIKKLFKKTGEFVMVTPPFHCTLGCMIEVGENFQCSYGLNIQDMGGVKIGSNVMIGPNCCINSSGHCIDYRRRIEGWSYAYPVTIGDNVFIGANVVINASKKEGIHIGDNSVIGAGSVVTKDIPANVLACGVPCRVVKTLNEVKKYKVEKI